MLGAALLPGTAPVAAQAIPAEVSRLGIGAIRVAIGGLAILTTPGRRRVRTAWRASPKRRLLFGAAGIAAYQVSFFAAVAKTGVGVATAIAAVASPLAAGLGRPPLGGGLPGGRPPAVGGGLLLTGAGR